MTDDFTTRLQVQLREAAEREARVGRLARAGREIPTRPVLAGLAVAAALVAAVVLAVGALHQERPAPTPAGPRVIADRPLVDQGGSLAAGAGAVWATDPSSGRLLRLDPATSEVRARIPVGARPVVQVANGGVWVVTPVEVLRIAHDRVAARIRPPEPTFGELLPGVGGPWVISADYVLHVDARRNVIDRRVRLSRAGYTIVGAATDGDVLYVSRGDGALLTLDARTGARRAVTHVARPAPLGGALDGAVIMPAHLGITLIDARTGRPRWTRLLGSPNGARLAGDTLWVQASAETGDRDRIWQLDARTGRVLGSLTLPEFGVAGMTTVGRDLWIVTPGGKLEVIE